MRIAIAALAVSSLGLLAGSLWPAPGRAVLLALPPGAPVAHAFGEEDWRVQRLSSSGPFTLLRAAPARPEADPLRLARASGALFATLAAPWADCSSD